MSALVLDRVSVTRGRGRNAVEALHGASLELRAGDVLLVEGPSGSGKTTLLCAAAGLLTPDTGVVRLDGHDLAALDPAARRAVRARRIGFVFQRSNLLAGLDVRDNVRLAAALAGLDRAEGERRTRRVLEQLGILALADRRPDQLSGGEEHRAAIARAVVHDPAVVLADEPPGSLDGVTGGAVARLLAAVARETGAAVMVATHDPRLREIGTRRLRIEDGRLEEVGRAHVV